ncbi:MAG: hypothetical protein A2Y12_04325 [Planctomycetes bacterium GWF2_42_9]|nr:MAG: hypothetical protein A2Y12_04325 [Planctomycetes bacterium GWF2_42_9]
MLYMLGCVEGEKGFNSMLAAVKKTILFKIVVVLALTTHTGFAATIISQNFDNTGTFVNGTRLNGTGVGNSATTDARWKLSGQTGYGGSLITSAQSFSSSKSLEVARLNANAYETGQFIGYVDNGINSGTAVVSFRAKRGEAGWSNPGVEYQGAGSTFIVGDNVKLDTVFPAESIGLRLHSDNALYVINNGVFVKILDQIDTPGWATPGTWHAYKMVIDVSSHVYDVYYSANGTDGGYVKLYDNASYNPNYAGSELNAVRAGALYYTTYRGPVWFDNVIMTSESAESEYVLENDAMKIIFSESASGFNCLSIENKLENNARFVEPSGSGLNWAGLWYMTFTNGSTTIDISNISVGIRSAQWQDNNTKLVLKWEDITLGADTGCLDVTANISLPSGNNPSTWTIAVANTSSMWGIESVRYPLLRTVCKSGTADVLLPTGAYGGTLKKNNTSTWNDHYPSGSPYCCMQFVAFNKGNAGLYIAAHDGNANYKTLDLTLDQHFFFDVLAENPNEAGDANLPAISFVVQAYSGNWWEAAKIYRDWALQQKWADEGWLADRTNIPGNFLDIGYWAADTANPNSWLGDDIFVTDMGRMKSTFAPLKLGLHWYGWNSSPFDTNYPEMFPILDQGIDDDIETFQAQGTSVMPYTNGLMWDTGLSNFTGTAQPAAVKDKDGNLVLAAGELGHEFAMMCPYTSVWQDKIHDLCERLINPNELDVDGIYLDQLGGHKPDLCYDSSHGHPLGGGHHWVDGYRTMLSNITTTVGSNAYLASEMFAEPYMDYIHGFLIGALYRATDDVPLMQAVYSGYANTFGALESECDSFGTFTLIQGTSFLYGVTPSWLKPYLLLADQNKTNLSVDLAKYRVAAKDYMVYGELVDEVPITETTNITKNIYAFFDHAGTTPLYSINSRAVKGTIWRTRDEDSLGIVVMNLDLQSRGATFTINVNDYLDNTSGMGIYNITPAGTAFVENLAATGIIERSLTLAAHEILVLAIHSNQAMCGDSGTLYLPLDLNRDCYVDLGDVAVFASQWLWCTDPANSNCDQYWK